MIVDKIYGCAYKDRKAERFPDKIDFKQIFWIFS